ncbi:MAG TPA: IS110 family transposase [Actinomycetes bacterium]|nr:IS110 family transposase [Actinomycetes bacterium]
MLFVGVDWGECHHDVCLLDQDGGVLAARRIADGVAGVGELHALVAAHAEDPAQVVVGIETDRGLLVGALLAAGYQLYGVNPHAVSRYRDRYGSARAKSDRGDAKVLADLVRTDRHQHRPVAGDTPGVEAVKVLARAHQHLVWARQRHTNALRSALREFYPGALAALGAQLAAPEALAVLALAPTPAVGRLLSRAALRGALVAAGRQRNVQARVVAIHGALAAPQLAAAEPVDGAYRQVVAALVVLLGCLNEQVDALEEQLGRRFTAHPDAAIVRSQPGLGVVLGARVLAEFGDDPDRYATAKGRKAFAGTAPVTRSSGLRRVVVARAARNERLVDACYLWAFAALTASAGARRCYDAHRARGATHHQALRALANRLVGILHGCLARRVAYDEAVAWPAPEDAAA